MRERIQTVLWEDVAQSGDTIADVAARLIVPARIKLPAGTFSMGEQSVVWGPGSMCRAIIGSGAEHTHLRL